MSDCITNINNELSVNLKDDFKNFMDILQMSLSELREYIDVEYEKNAALDICKWPKVENSIVENKNKTFNKVDFDNNSTILEINDELSCLENSLEKKKSLKEYLYEQLAEVEGEEKIINICRYIIESLNNTGYLKISVERLSKELNEPKKNIEKGLKIIQSLEPYGVGARNVKECLSIQGLKLNLLDDKIKCVIERYLEQIGKKNYDIVARKMRTTEEEVRKIANVIKKLEPKPGRGFYTGDVIDYIMADAEIKNVDGQLSIRMNNNVLPKLIINNSYNELLNNYIESHTKIYIEDRIKKASELIEEIELRNKILYNLLKYIVDERYDFFRRGLKFKNYLNLKKVGNKLNIPLSMLEKIVMNKYILTNYGTIKLEELFE